MNILIDARPLCIPNPGGVTRVTRQLIDELFVADAEDTFFLGTTGWMRPALPWKEDARHYQIHRSVPNKLVSGLATFNFISFEHWMRPIKADLLFLPNIGFVGIPRIPYVLLVHDLTFLTEPSWYSLHGQLWHKAVHAVELITHATHLVTICEYVKEDLKRQLHVPEERITVLPFTPGANGFPKELPPTLEGKRYVLSLGANDPRKNARATVSAWNRLRSEKDFQDIQLVLIGGTPEKEVLSLPGLHHFKRPTDDALATLYKYASVFSYPSWAEGYGLPLQEAARFKTPCITSSGSTLEETAPIGTLFIPPEKPHLLAEAIRSQLILPQKTSLRFSSAKNQSGYLLATLFKKY